MNCSGAEQKVKSSMCCAGLRFLVRLCTDMGLNEVQDYATKLKKVEKMRELREQVHPNVACSPTGLNRSVRIKFVQMVKFVF